MKLQTLSTLALLLALFSSSVVGAEEAKPTSTPVPITVTDVWLNGSRQPAPSPQPSPVPDFMRTDAGLRDRILVEVEGLADAIQKDKINPRDLVLYLNGQELEGTKAVAVEGPKQNWLAFDLKRTEQSDRLWRSLLGSPTSAYRRVNVSVGFPGKQAIPTTTGKVQPTLLLRLYYGRWVVICVALVILAVCLFVLGARKGAFIRDRNPPDPPPGEMKPYSLALTQAAWWFFLIIGSFGFIYLITGDYNTVSDQALILMGIGTGTALGAFMVDATKRDNADAQLGILRPAQASLAAEVDELNKKRDRLEQKIRDGGEAAAAEAQSALRENEVALSEKQAKLKEIENQVDDAKSGLSKPTSVGFRKDILTDVNGITLHRFQMVAWTLVLGVVFLLGVYRELAMPAFSVTLLALMGISAGTYLGFKIPERQTDPKDEKKPPKDEKNS